MRFLLCVCLTLCIVLQNIEEVLGKNLTSSVVRGCNQVKENILNCEEDLICYFKKNDIRDIIMISGQFGNFCTYQKINLEYSSVYRCMSQNIEDNYTANFKNDNRCKDLFDGTNYSASNKSLFFSNVEIAIIGNLITDYYEEYLKKFGRLNFDDEYIEIGVVDVEDTNEYNFVMNLNIDNTDDFARYLNLYVDKFAKDLKFNMSNTLVLSKTLPLYYSSNAIDSAILKEGDSNIHELFQAIAHSIVYNIVNYYLNNKNITHTIPEDKTEFRSIDLESFFMIEVAKDIVSHIIRTYNALTAYYQLNVVRSQINKNKYTLWHKNTKILYNSDLNSIIKINDVLTINSVLENNIDISLNVTPFVIIALNVIQLNLLETSFNRNMIRDIIKTRDSTSLSLTIPFGQKFTILSYIVSGMLNNQV